MVFYKSIIKINSIHKNNIISITIEGTHNFTNM